MNLERQESVFTVDSITHMYYKQVEDGGPKANKEWKAKGDGWKEKEKKGREERVQQREGENSD